MTRVLLLPSPLLPRLSAERFATALSARWWRLHRERVAVGIAAFPKPPPDGQAVLEVFRTSVAVERPDVVLTHSNGGRFAALAAPGIPVVHVDAALPAASGEELPMAPAPMLDRLAGLADDDGLLPPWSRWWAEEDVAAVLPDRTALAHLREHEHRMPLSYFRSRLGAPVGWTEQPQAYLAFGGTYAEETAFAREHGWPTVVVDRAHHLHHLVAPDAVAAHVVDLVSRLGVARVRSAPGRAGTPTE